MRQSAAWRKANPEKTIAISKTYYEANREKEAARKRAYNKANPEIAFAKNKAFRDANPQAAIINVIARKYKVLIHEVRSLVPQELIEIKMLQIQLRRLIIARA